MKNVIETIILNGKLRGENILLAFAITINKSQDQKMSVCVLDLSTSCFSHGQLYMACSRTIQFVLAKDWITKHIVYSVALRD
jgi:hypothetical protein